jgi:hypothetical protein
MKLIYDLRSVGQSLLVSDSHLELMTRFSFFCVTFVGFLMSDALSDERMGLVKLLQGLAGAITLGTKSRRTHIHILLSHLRLPQPGGPGHRIYIPHEQSAQLYPRALSSLSVAWSYSDSPRHGLTSH